MPASPSDRPRPWVVGVAVALAIFGIAAFSIGLPVIIALALIVPALGVTGWLAALVVVATVTIWWAILAMATARR